MSKGKSFFAVVVMIWLLLATACSQEGRQTGTSSASEGTTSGLWVEREEKVESSTQPFSLNLPAGFVLSEEEPGTDVVLSEADERAFIRIQLFDDSAQSADYVMQNTPLMLNGVSDNAQLERLPEAPVTISEGSQITAWRVTYADGNVLAMVFQQNHHWVRVTVFNHGDSETVFLKIIASLRTHAGDGQPDLDAQTNHSQ